MSENSNLWNAFISIKDELADLWDKYVALQEELERTHADGRRKKCEVETVLKELLSFSEERVNHFREWEKEESKKQSQLSKDRLYLIEIALNELCLMQIQIRKKLLRDV